MAETRHLLAPDSTTEFTETVAFLQAHRTTCPAWPAGCTVYEHTAFEVPKEENGLKTENCVLNQKHLGTPEDPSDRVRA